MKTLSFLIKKLSFGLIWLLLGFGLFSCEPDPIEIELPPHEQKLVIATQVFLEKYMVVQVSKSFCSGRHPKEEEKFESDFEEFWVEPTLTRRKSDLRSSSG